MELRPCLLFAELKHLLCFLSAPYIPTKLPVIVFLPIKAEKKKTENPQLATINAIEISESKIPEQFFPTFDFNSQREREKKIIIIVREEFYHSNIPNTLGNHIPRKKFQSLPKFSIIIGQ
jgi:hypothetical protein